MRTYSQRRQDFFFKNLLRLEKPTHTAFLLLRVHKNATALPPEKNPPLTGSTTRRAGIAQAVSKSKQESAQRPSISGQCTVSCRKSHLLSIPAKPAKFGWLEDCRAIGLGRSASSGAPSIPVAICFASAASPGSRVGLDKPGFANFFPTVRMSAPARPRPPPTRTPSAVARGCPG